MSQTHISYWNGFISRAEAQKVYDEQAGVIRAQAVAIQKIDMCLACVCEKLGVKPEDVNKWAQDKANSASSPASTEQTN